MSGTSLDGLDVAHCSFEKSGSNQYSFRINNAKTYDYSDDLKNRLKEASKLNALEFSLINNELGKLFGDKCKEFIEENKLKVDLISSHGHTIFHQPENGITIQIGNGAVISSITSLPVASDFRSQDVALGGQGAPLVPIGDKLLFSEYDACLNLGGIANISFDHQSKRVAYDICFFNIVFNFLSKHFDKEFDESGNIAASGNVVKELLDELNNWSYYKQAFPKSLGIESFESEINPLINQYINKYTINDIMSTFSEHFANKIAEVLNDYKLKNVLITGGGTYNSHFLRVLKSKTGTTIVIPDSKTINFKEALVFAFLGYLRYHEEINILSSVTGAKKDHCGGLLYQAG